jgi:hypothetical protein
MKGNSNSVFSTKQFPVTQIFRFSALWMMLIKITDTFISLLYYVSCIIIACPIFGTRVQHFRQTKHVDHYMKFGDHCDKNNLQWPGENHVTGRAKTKFHKCLQGKIVMAGPEAGL